MPGSLDAQRLPLQALTAHFSAAPDVLRLTQLQLDLGPGGRASGAAELRGDGLQTELVVEQLDLHALHAALRPTALGGSVRARNSRGVQEVAVDLAQQGIRVSAAATHRDNVLRVASLAASWRAARLDASGQIATFGTLCLQSERQSQTRQPCRAGGVSGGDDQRRGGSQWAPPAAVEHSPGVSTARQPVAAAGALGAGHAYALGSASAGWWMRASRSVRIACNCAARLAQPKIAWSLTSTHLPCPCSAGAGRDVCARRALCRGCPRVGSLRATAAATDLVVPGGYRAQDVQLNVELGDGEDPRIALDASATLLRAHGVGIKSFRAHAEGKRSRHAIQLEVAREAIALNAALEGALAPDWRLWSGRVVALRNSGNYAFELESPCPLSISLARVAFGPAAVRSTYGRLASGRNGLRRGSTVG